MQQCFRVTAMSVYLIHNANAIPNYSHIHFSWLVNLVWILIVYFSFSVFLPCKYFFFRSSNWVYVIVVLFLTLTTVFPLVINLRRHDHDWMHDSKMEVHSKSRFLSLKLKRQRTDWFLNLMQTASSTVVKRLSNELNDFYYLVLFKRLKCERLICQSEPKKEAFKRVGLTGWTLYS